MRNMSFFFFGAGILCILYYMVILVYAGSRADFAWIWLLGCAFFVGLGAVFFQERAHPGWLPGFVRLPFFAAFGMGVFIFFVLGAQVIGGMFAKEEEGLEYVIVLGAQVKGKVPSRALKKRLDKAVDYGKKNPDTRFILSGGRGPGEEITEARCMYDYMTGQGIGGFRLILEEGSATTKENLIYSHELTGCREKKVGILSNNFHIKRALLLAKKQGYQQVYGVPAPSDMVMQAHYVVREIFALLKERAVGNI